MRRFLCGLFGHHRDAKRARPSNGGWRSSCLWCGERMVRVAPGQWCLASEYHPPASRPSEGSSWHRALRRRSDHPDAGGRSQWGVRDLFEDGETE